jgi:hypothetical protein
MGTLTENHLVPAETSGQSLEAGYLSREAADLQRREQMEGMGIPIRDLPPGNLEPSVDFKLHPEIVLASGSDREPFVIARQNPQRIVADLARSSIFGIWGGAALALLSFGLVVKWLGLW